MRVLHVVQRYWPCVGGAERYVQEISERLVKQGHSVDVVTTDALDWEYFWDPRAARISAPEQELNGVHIRRFPVRHWPVLHAWAPRLRRVMAALSPWPASEPLLWTLARWSTRLPDLERHLRDPGARYDLIHAVNILFEGIGRSAQDWARAQSIPFVFTPFVHLAEAESEQVRRFYTMRHQLGLLARSDCVMVQTPREREALAGRGVSRERLQVLGMGVTPEEVTGGCGEGWRERHGIKGRVILFMGAVAYDKGAVHLVEALSRLGPELGDVTLVLAGPVRGPFQHLLTQLPPEVRARCLLPGVVVGEEKRDLLAAADLLAMPSRSDSFGIVFLEAWACGLPVIGACAGGLPDVICDGEDGFLVPFGDVAALADRLRQLLQDRDLARQMGERGRLKTLDHSTWDRVYRDVRSTYERLVQAGNRL